MKKDAKRVIRIFIIICAAISVFLINKFFGRSVPYHGNDKDIKEVKDVSVLACYSDLSKNISLENIATDINLIPNAYAKRTLIALEYKGYANNFKNNETSSLYLEGNIIQSDNFIFINGDNVYEIFIVDNEYNIEDTKNITVSNSSLFNEDHIELSNVISKDSWITEGLSHGKALISIDGIKFLRLPNISSSEMVLMPLENMKDNYIFKVIQATSNKDGSVLDGYNHKILHLDGSDWLPGKISPIVVHTHSSSGRLPVEDVSLLINDKIVLPY